MACGRDAALSTHESVLAVNTLRRASLPTADACGKSPSMARDQPQPALVGLAEVLFVGGPFHGRRMVMAHPEFHMMLELESGEPIEYCRRMVEAEMRDGRYVNVATYAPTGISDVECSRLVIDVPRKCPDVSGDR